MSWGIVAGAAVGVIGGIASADAQRSASNKAADAQERAAQLQVDEIRRQFDSVQKLLSPFAQGGTAAFGAYGDLAGINGTAKQSAALAGIQSSPQFTSMVQQGENAILQNASATGGLRGGNTQSALAQFRPQLLTQLVNEQFARLGNMASVGQNAAAGVGNAGMQAAGGISNAYAQQAAAQAGAALAGGYANSQLINGAAGAFGQLLSNWNTNNSQFTGQQGQTSVDWGM